MTLILELPFTFSILKQIFINRVAGEIICLVASVCVRVSVHLSVCVCVCPFDCGHYPVWIVQPYKKHLKNVGPIHHCEPPHAAVLHCHSLGVTTVARCLRYSYSYRVHNNNDDDNNDNAWQRGPLWPHRMDPINAYSGGSRHGLGWA